MCSASGHVLQMPPWASTRRSERFLSTRREGSHASGVFLYGSLWNAHRATVRNSDGCMRLWENAVDRSGVVKCRSMVCPKNGRTAKHHFPHKWAKRNLLFFERVPNASRKTFAVFPAFYSFLSNGHFCPLALYGKTQ